MKHLILASGSPRRRELMSQVGLDFTVVTSDADENIKEMEPEDYVRELSSIKAQSVLEQYADKDDSVIVIGADTIVYYKGEILTKPKNEEDAFRILKSLEGQIHQVYTGVTICSAHKNVSFYEKTDVWVYDMTDEEIRDYISTGEPMDKAGAYGIQGKFAAYIKGIEGDYNNVVGLPVARLVHELKAF
ncbi:Maf family protein [Lachnospira eligens]|jgi:septum formation protein|uniref:dTTP/UTP pyrophosphatase n=1 Tax=Lachnospira eligens TaxID=39485 RepID=A0A414DFY2_9FIRM|nr:Maf family protein [Lachnospira eligens]RGT52738.1 septum formation protein Maf [Lachnospira eligens]RHD09610.1 septum formation protein Maf [Lachnospira eligens]RHK56657.1 septum formation protein Maf [Lachnospira eligens]RHK88944.1 septum formation protein Maf [Lachnospira eligens]